MKKIISILMISIVCISNFIGIFGTNKVKAAIAPIENAKPYSKGEVVLFSYDGIGIGGRNTSIQKRWNRISGILFKQRQKRCGSRF